ncbi:hypothetical protein KUCAC02_037804, partial [Chaenocephalus aceratus]
ELGAAQQPNGPVLSYRLLWTERPVQQGAECGGTAPVTVSVTTQSDAPSAPPQNITLEVVLSR